MSTTFFTAGPELGWRSRSRAVWEAGDSAVLAPYHEPAAAEFLARLPVIAGERVLDLACGTGNVALQAAGAGCVACGVDIAGNLVRKARERAARAGLSAAFTEGDLEALPFADASFDWVVSLFGISYAPRPEVAAAEMLRVCRPGGRMALGNWSPHGVLGEAARLVARREGASVPGERSMVSWGDDVTMRTRLAGGCEGLRCTPRTARLHFPFSPGRTVDFLGQFHGPWVRVLAGLDGSGRASLRGELAELFHRHNRASGPDATELAAEYLEVTAVRCAGAGWTTGV